MNRIKGGCGNFVIETLVFNATVKLELEGGMSYYYQYYYYYYYYYYIIAKRLPYLIASR
jgi:hypothetical protein